MQSITVQQLRERAGTPLIDVREEYEYAAGHVPGAVNLPMSTIGARLDESREIVRYLAGLLVFLGLLGTFWGLIDTVGSVGRIIGYRRLERLDT